MAELQKSGLATTNTGRRTRIAHWATTLAVVAAVGASLATIGMTAEPYGRIDGEGIPPLAVTVRPVRHLEGYVVVREFVGVVEARKESRVGFELGGEVTDPTTRHLSERFSLSEKKSGSTPTPRLALAANSRSFAARHGGSDRRPQPMSSHRVSFSMRRSSARSCST